MDAPRGRLNLVSRQRAETHATTKPTMSAGTPDCFWAGETMMSGGIAAACSPGGSWPGRSIRSPNSSDQDVGNSHTARWLSFPMSEMGQSQPGRASSKCGYVRHAPQSGSNFLSQKNVDGMV